MTFALSISMLELIIFEIGGFLDASSRFRLWQTTLLVWKSICRTFFPKALPIAQPRGLCDAGDVHAVGCVEIQLLLPDLHEVQLEGRLQRALVREQHLGVEILAGHPARSMPRVSRGAPVFRSARYVDQIPTQYDHGEG